MAKSLRSYGKGSTAQDNAIYRRIKSETYGLGFWASADAMHTSDSYVTRLRAERAKQAIENKLAKILKIKN